MSALQETQTTTSGTDSPEFYLVSLDKKQHGRELGVSVDFTPNQTLKIKAINEGMIKRSNEAQQDQRRVQEGDEMLKVNEVTGDGKKMAAECKKSERLRILFKARAVAETSDAKRPKVGTQASSSSDATLGGLYDFLPASNPENEKLAKKNAEDADAVGRCVSYARNRCVFLDIDGVIRPLQGSTFCVSTINIDGISIPMAGLGSDFLPSAMAQLRYIISQTGAQIVLSSEWRRHSTLKDGLVASLRLNNLPPLYGETTTDIDRELGAVDPLVSFAERRVKEIGTFLDKNPWIDSWVAIDDIDLAISDLRKQLGKPSIADHFVRTADDIGLTEENARKAVEILCRKEAQRGPG